MITLALPEGVRVEVGGGGSGQCQECPPNHHGRTLRVFRFDTAAGSEFMHLCLPHAREMRKLPLVAPTPATEPAFVEQRPKLCPLCGGWMLLPYRWPYEGKALVCSWCAVKGYRSTRPEWGSYRILSV